ncbi:hypothetical protein MMC25_005818 [Agyrium rufum]|nr:hypothetical protein [Agyrium rufum]
MDGGRNGNKRNSGVFSSSALTVQRRTSKKASSTDRHGHVYSEDFTDKTGRAITPEPEMSSSRQSTSPIANAIFPRSSAASSPEIQPRGKTSSSSRRKMNGTEGNGGSNYANQRLAQALSRPRTRTMEERIRERSPTASASKTRSRIGSLQTPTLPAVEIPPHPEQGSIGYPFIVPSPTSPMEIPSRQRLVKPAPQPLPIPNLSAGQVSTRSTPYQSPTRDTTKILNLMKTTQGRMHGILSFRTIRSGAWTSGYCAINVGDGKLIYQTKGDITLAKTLIPDLRGCKVRTMWDRESQQTFLQVSTRNNGLSIHLRPHVPETFDSWLAALLCWQPIASKGIQNKMMKPQATVQPERRDKRRSTAANMLHAPTAKTIKVSNMLYWDASKHSESHNHTAYRRYSTYKQQRMASSAWQQVSGTLQDDGEFAIYIKAESRFVTKIPLSSLSRCAIQRLDATVLDDDFTIAIYPQYTATNALVPEFPDMRPIYLSFDSRVYFEVWFVLLRAFTIPELYGPENRLPNPESRPLSPGRETKNQDVSNLLRMERLLSIRIVEAKMHSPKRAVDAGSKSSPVPPSGHSANGSQWVPGDYYAEAKLDDEVRARTAVKSNTHNPFWREEYEFHDLPPVLSSAIIVLKSRNSEQRDWTLIADDPLNYENGEINPLASPGDIEISPLDMDYGTVELRLEDLDRGKDTEKWWPIINENDEITGELLMKVRTDDVTVLMSHHYQPLCDLLCSFSNGLTQQIVSACPAETHRLSAIFLNIFQDLRNANDWIMFLVEDEIDGIHKDSLSQKFRFSRRIASHDSYDFSVDREIFVRDMGKTATVEANLLFRGNSLLTKSLELYMRRVGKEYLEETLSESLRDIDESDPDCEVDPHRQPIDETRKRNWSNLIALTENIWRAISSSATRCPLELRLVCRHIRACAEDRYGDFMRSIRYSSVSGFLFLRFFVPAVLNPKLFNLLKDHPRPRAARTLTLIAKGLQALANLNPLGTKEPWMTPMNDFLSRHREDFRDFVDGICSINQERTTLSIPPAYATPITIAARLPPTSREGFLSLPYLLDRQRDLAVLVATWEEGRIERGIMSGESEELRTFDDLCRHLHQKTKECLTMAESAERPSGVLESRWEELVQQMNRKSSGRSLADSIKNTDREKVSSTIASEPVTTVTSATVVPATTPRNGLASHLTPDLPIPLPPPPPRILADVMEHPNSSIPKRVAGGSSLSSSTTTGNSSPVQSTFGDSYSEYVRSHPLPHISAANEEDDEDIMRRAGNRSSYASRRTIYALPPVRSTSDSIARPQTQPNPMRNPSSPAPGSSRKFFNTAPLLTRPSTDSSASTPQRPPHSRGSSFSDRTNGSAKSRLRSPEGDLAKQSPVTRFNPVGTMTSNASASGGPTSKSVGRAAGRQMMAMSNGHRKGSESFAGPFDTDLVEVPTVTTNGSNQAVSGTVGRRSASGSVHSNAENRRRSWGPRQSAMIVAAAAAAVTVKSNTTEERIESSPSPSAGAMANGRWGWNGRRKGK